MQESNTSPLSKGNLEKRRNVNFLSLVKKALYKLVVIILKRGLQQISLSQTLLMAYY